MILNGHGSHTTSQFNQACRENNIILIYMPPHSSHLLQPLDISYFLVLKQSYSRVIENKARLGFNYINKLDFLAACPQARNEAYKSVIIINSFTATGIHPYNPDGVISKLDIKLRTPTPVGSSSSSGTWSLKTLHNLKELTRQASLINLQIQL